MIKSKHGTVKFKGVSNLDFATDVLAAICSYIEYETQSLDEWSHAADNFASMLEGATKMELSAKAMCALRKGIRLAYEWYEKGNAG